jgi:hypothetical protein
MKEKRLKLCTIFLFAVGLTGLQAQDNVNASGGQLSGTGGSVAYSVGQLVYSVHTGPNGSVSEGVQQPYEISTLTGIEEIAINFTVSTFPNPITDYLTLQVDVNEDHNIELMSYFLYDNNGKLLRNEKITGSHTSIDMSNLSPAIYFVKVMEENNDVKTFKIIKN